MVRLVFLLDNVWKFGVCAFTSDVIFVKVNSPVCRGVKRQTICPVARWPCERFSGDGSRVLITWWCSHTKKSATWPTGFVSLVVRQEKQETVAVVRGRRRPIDVELLERNHRKELVRVVSFFVGLDVANEQQRLIEVTCARGLALLFSVAQASVFSMTSATALALVQGHLFWVSLHSATIFCWKNPLGWCTGKNHFHKVTVWPNKEYFYALKFGHQFLDYIFLCVSLCKYFPVTCDFLELNWGLAEKNPRVLLLQNNKKRKNITRFPTSTLDTWADLKTLKTTSSFLIISD